MKNTNSNYQKLMQHALGETSRILLLKNKKIEDMIESAKHKMIPPLKGDITRGKLKWRGIKLNFKPDMNGEFVYITQRGNTIGEVLYFPFYRP